MTDPKDSPYRLLWMLGLAMTLPMILLSGPLAGYFIGYVLVHRLHFSNWIPPVLMGFGLLGSAWQTYLLIRKIKIED